MAAPAPAAIVEEPIEPLPYKKWFLKVSIHCEGCKRKVRKVLHSVEGVYSVDIDTKQQKAVVIGNVDADTLIKKLTKSGKHAELWPETVTQRDKKSKKSTKKEKQNGAESSTDEDTEKQPVKVEEVQGSPKSSGATAVGGGVAKSSGVVRFSDGVAKSGGGAVRFSDSTAKSNASGVQVVDVKPEGKNPETGSAGKQYPATATAVPQKMEGESDGGNGKSGGGGGGGKRKKKKGAKVGIEGEPSSGGAPACTGSPNHHAGPPSVNLSHPRHPEHQYPSHYYAPSPVYDVSHHTAYPSSRHTESYYASPQPHSYSYTYSGSEMEPPPDSYARQPLDSFELFSDENPNGCSVM